MATELSAPAGADMPAAEMSASAFSMPWSADESEGEEWLLEPHAVAALRSRRPYDDDFAGQVSERAVVLRALLIAMLTSMVSMSMISLAAAKHAAGTESFAFEYVTVTLIQEVCKLCIACFLFQQELRAKGSKVDLDWNALRRHNCLRFGIPGLLYCFENNFQYVILTFMQPAELAVLWNFKIFATALLLRACLGHRYTLRQWAALAVLVGGCAVTQAAEVFSPPPRRPGGLPTSHAPVSPTAVVLGHAHWSGSAVLGASAAKAGPSKLVGAALSVFGSSIAAASNVCCEWLLKKRPDDSIHLQNIQLYFFGALLNLMTLSVKVALEPHSPIHGHSGFFTGYSGWVWVVVLLGSCSGILISVMLKHTDNIAVIFSHALAMVVVAVVSAKFFGLVLTGPFICGGVLVLLAMYAFYSGEGRPPRNAGCSDGARASRLLPKRAGSSRGGGALAYSTLSSAAQ